MIHGLSITPGYDTYISGKLGLAGLDLSTDLATWLDAVYAAYADAPHDVLKELMAGVVKAEARLRPQDARATWGLTPEHQAMAGKLGAKGAAGDVEKLPPLPSGSRRRRPS